MNNTQPDASTQPGLPPGARPTQRSGPSRREQILLALCGVLALVAAGIWISFKGRYKPPPTPGGLYYTGPMKSKSGNGYATDDGRAVPPPPGARP